VNALVLTAHRPDRPCGGAPLRNWQNIRALASLGPVDVVSIGVDAAGEAVAGIREWIALPAPERPRIDPLTKWTWVVRRGRHPVLDGHYSRAASAWLRRRVTERRYDVAVVEGIALAAYIPALTSAGCRVVFDAHNVEAALHAALVRASRTAGAPVVRRLKDRLVRRRLAEAERRAVLGADVVWACSGADARAIERAYRPRSPVSVVVNGVDVEAYRDPGGDRRLAWPPDPITLVYPGAFRYLPNEDAAMRLINEVLPAIRRRGRAARVVLVGRDPTPAMLAASRADPDVEITGAVDSVLPYMHRPCVVALPIAVGSGTRLKVVEAFAAGRPVVSTAKGAEGLDVVDGRHLLIREDPDEIAAGAIDVWRQRWLREHLCRHALELVRTRYSWAVAARSIARSIGREPDEQVRRPRVVQHGG
jgi:glycosyltransferase involved in cell wall biosynthesis